MYKFEYCLTKKGGSMKKLLIILITLLFISFAGNISPPMEDVTYDIEMIETISQDVPVTVEIKALYYQATWICTSMPGELFTAIIGIDEADVTVYTTNREESEIHKLYRRSVTNNESTTLILFNDIGYNLQPAMA